MSAVAVEKKAVGRKKIENPVPFTNCKVRSDLVDKARSMLYWVRSQLPESERIEYSLQDYLSDLIDGRRDLHDDFAAYAAWIAKAKK